VAGHAAGEALAAAALLAGFVVLVSRAGLPRGWPRPAGRRRALIRATGSLALGAASWTAVVGSSLLVGAPVVALTLLLAAAPQIVLALAWLTRPRLAVADRLAGLAAVIGVGWLVGWSGALPLGGHLEPGPDQALALVLQVTLLLWLTLGTRRPAVAPLAGERVRLGREKLTVSTGAPVGGVPGRLAGSR
jgi:hypothetical protein